MGYSSGSSSQATRPSPSPNGYKSVPLQRPSYLSQSLIDSRFDSDSCGVGFVAQLSAEPSHQILDHALRALGRLEHRGAVAADGKSSDGVGVTVVVPRSWFLAETGLQLSAHKPLGVAVLFLPDDQTAQHIEI